MDILIEESEGQLWAAAMDGQRLCGLEVDPVDEAVRWGSLYYAKIKRWILRAMRRIWIWMALRSG